MNGGERMNHDGKHCDACPIQGCDHRIQKVVITHVPVRRRAKMPWDGDIAHTKLSDGSVVLRGSREDAVDKFGAELVEAVESAD